MHLSVSASYSHQCLSAFVFIHPCTYYSYRSINGLFATFPTSLCIFPSTCLICQSPEPCIFFSKFFQPWPLLLSLTQLQRSSQWLVLFCIDTSRKVWTQLGNHQSILLNCNQSPSGLSWRLPTWYGVLKSECVRSNVSRGCECVAMCGKARSFTLASFLRATPRLLTCTPSQHPPCESLSDGHSPLWPLASPFASAQHFPLLSTTQNLTHHGV